MREKKIIVSEEIIHCWFYFYNILSFRLLGNEIAATDYVLTEAVIDYGIQDEAVANEFEFLRNFMTLNDLERMIIGQDFDSFIKGCTFRGKDCLESS